MCDLETYLWHRMYNYKNDSHQIKKHFAMDTLTLLQANGAIIKTESMATITENIMPHTVVVEADRPYSNYYGVAPFNMPTKPNSLFLFTSHYYSLEEVLRFAKLVELSCMQTLNIAVSVLQFKSYHYPAIRIKNFPDYKMIYKLQECFAEQGVEFTTKAHLKDSAIIRTNKCFSLEEIEPNLYIDHLQENTGYIALPKLINEENYLQVISKIRNNTSCPLFDAARGSIILGSEITDIIRIYSGHLDLEMLKCIQEKFGEVL